MALNVLEYSVAGDPAAACCSVIPELFNPHVNGFLTGKSTHVFNIEPFRPSEPRLIADDDDDDDDDDDVHGGIDEAAPARATMITIGATEPMMSPQFS